MKPIKEFDEAIENKIPSLKDVGINATMFWAYRYSKTAGSDDLNFYETIWNNDIENIVETCRANGIEVITISSTFSGLPEVLWEFCKRGCVVDGMKLMPMYYTEWDWKKKEEIRRQVPAVILKIN